MIFKADETEALDIEALERKAKIEKQFKDELAEARNYWDPIYEKCKKHRRFTLLGKQFDDGQAKRFGFDNPSEPNLLLTYLNHEANSTLQTDYSPTVIPNGNGMNEIQARAREEVLRGLQRKHDLSQVLNQARRNQCAGGIYYAWVNTPYSGKSGFDKTIVVEGIEHTFNVYPDPYVKTATFCDARRWFYKQDIPRMEWEAETGLSPDSGWMGKKTKEVWHMFVREDESEEQYLTEDSQTVFESELPEDEETGEPDKSNVATEENEPISRKTSNTKWCWYKFAEDKLIDKEDLLGKESPFVACTGRKVIDGDKVEYQPLTQFAETPQMTYTIITNIIKLRLARSPYSKWKYAFESIVSANDLQAIRDSAVMGDTDIPFKAFDAKGNSIPAPEEIQPYILDPVLIQLKQDAELQIQKIFGIWEANLGQRSNESSAIAIEARAKGGETSNYDLNFNFMEFIEQIGRAELDYIPKVLTADQQLKFVDQTDQQVVAWIRQFGDTVEDEEFGLAIEALPTEKTARQEEAERLAQLASKVPLVAQNPQAMAIVIAAQPGRHSQELADIVKGVDPKLQQAQGMIQELQGKLQQVTQQAQVKAQSDMLKQQGLQATAQSLRAQMQIIQKSKAGEGQTDSGMTALEARFQELEIQLKQFHEESIRMDSETKRLQALGSLIPQPQPTPQLGEALA